MSLNLDFMDETNELQNGDIEMLEKLLNFAAEKENVEDEQ